MIERQNNAAHSWGVAILVQCLWPDARKEVLLEALHHDIGERKYGDMPAPGKAALPGVREEMHKAEAEYRKQLGAHYDLTEDEKWMVKGADLLDLMFHILEERELGNTTLDHAALWCYEWLVKNMPTHIGAPIWPILAEWPFPWRTP